MTRLAHSMLPPPRSPATRHPPSALARATDPLYPKLVLFLVQLASPCSLEGYHLSLCKDEGYLTRGSQCGSLPVITSSCSQLDNPHSRDLREHNRTEQNRAASFNRVSIALNFGLSSRSGFNLPESSPHHACGGFLSFRKQSPVL